MLSPSPSAGAGPVIPGDLVGGDLGLVRLVLPGFRERVIGTSTESPAGFAVDNPNFVGGDILTGAKDVRQLVFGPRITPQPYDTGWHVWRSSRRPRALHHLSGRAR